MPAEPIKGGLDLDLTKLPMYGQDEDRMKELNQAQLEIIDSLRKRYEQPNWFKVAAGFAKPQLGGFLASLGSAAEAMGETEEQRRASEIPIAQMRLQLAQSNIILGANKKVNEDIENYFKTHKKPPTAAMIRDWAARSPNNPTVKALQQELADTHQQQTLLMEKLREKAKTSDLSPAEMKWLSDNGLDGESMPQVKPEPAVNVPPAVNAPSAENVPPRNVSPIDNFVSESDGNKQNVTGTAEMYPVAREPLALEDQQNQSAQSRPIDESRTLKEGTTRLLDNGARVNEDVYKLAKLGVPVVSNIRTREEQEALKDHPDPDHPGRWLTKEGYPVGEDSKHLRGEAIDIDPKRLTNEAKKVLEENGWYQPEWAKQRDPIHWERRPVEKVEAKLAEAKPAVKAEDKAPEKAEQKVEFYPPSVRAPDISGMTEKKAQSAMDSYKKRADAAEAPYIEKMQGWDSLMHGTEYTSAHNRYDRAIEMMQERPDLARKVFAIIKNSGEWAAALNAGFSGNIAGASAGLRFPMDDFIRAGLPQEAKDYADEIGAHLLRIAFDNLKASGVPLKGAQNEAMKQLQTSAHIDRQADAAYKDLLKDRANFIHSKEIYDTVRKEYGRYHDVNKSITPYSDIWTNSQALRDLDEKYRNILKKYDKFRLPPPKGTTP